MQEAMKCMKELCSKHFNQQQLNYIQTLAGMQNTTIICFIILFLYVRTYIHMYHRKNIIWGSWTWEVSQNQMCVFSFGCSNGKFCKTGT